MMQAKDVEEIAKIFRIQGDALIYYFVRLRSANGACSHNAHLPFW